MGIAAQMMCRTAFALPEGVVIAASAGAGGAIDPSGDVSVALGADQEFVITAADGFVVADVLVDDVSVGAVASYLFEDVTADHTIAASFSAVDPSFRSVGSTAYSASGGDVQPGMPTGWEVNDALVCVVGTQDNTTFPTAPAGWSVDQAGIGTTGAGGTCGLAQFSRRAQAGDVAPIISYAGEFPIVAKIIAVKDAARSAGPIGTVGTPQANGNANATVTAPAISTAADGALVVIAGVNSDGVSAASYSGSPTPTERFDNGGGTDEVAIFIATFTQAAAGDTGARTATLSAGAARIGMQTEIRRT